MKLISALMLVLTAACCYGQQRVPLIATPNRPTVTNTAETTQFGVLEIEFGVAAGAKPQSLQGLLKFGLLNDVELDLAGNPWQYDAPIHYVVVGDTNIGMRWRFLHQTKQRPTLTIQYSTKIPTSGPVEGSGEVDHTLTFLGSKDLPARLHLDANLSHQWLGRTAAGFDHNWLPAFALSYSLTDKWDIAMEFSGATRANADTAAVTQNLWAVSYTLTPRLVLDSAVQLRITGEVPAVVYLGGFTYSIAGLYHRRP
jgi:hypothetical protein